MPVDRLLPDRDAADLIALTRDICDKVLSPIVDEHERAETYPEGVFAQLGAAGLLYTIPSLALFVLLPLVLGTRILDPLNVVVALTIDELALLVRTVSDGWPV